MDGFDMACQNSFQLVRVDLQALRSSLSEESMNQCASALFFNYALMRILMYILASIALMFIGVQVATTMSTSRTEQQAYTVLRTIGDLEVRLYPEALSATVLRPGGSYKEISSPGFRTLAGYIFGGNTEEQKIAMTAPVHMEMGADSSRMRFVLPSGMSMESLPTPNDSNVRLERLPEEVVAVLRFSGYADDASIAEHSTLLMKAVRAAGLTPMGKVRFLGYDPPWQLVGRRNEVAVAVVPE